MADDVAPQSQIDQLHQLEALVSRKVSQIDEQKEKLKNFREQVKNVTDNDEQLQKAEQAANDTVTAVQKRKAEIRNLPEVRSLKMQMKEVSDDLKELQESLNNHLVNLHQLTGTKEFTTLTGETREFELVAKLKPKKKS
jgi:DNA repair exonuclease SbcCD ATPase subunit